MDRPKTRHSVGFTLIFQKEPSRSAQVVHAPSVFLFIAMQMTQIPADPRSLAAADCPEMLDVFKMTCYRDMHRTSLLQFGRSQHVNTKCCCGFCLSSYAVWSP